GIELAGHYEAAGLGAEVGGDWYDAFALPDGRLGVVIGDVAGRGIAAASTMGQLRSVARAFAVTEEGRRTPGEVLTCMNDHQLVTGSGDMFTVMYALIDSRRHSLAWSSAGHPPPLLLRPGGLTEYLRGGGGLMGI